MTFRAVETLRTVDLVLCEDTRTSLSLLAEYKIETPLESYHEHNEDHKKSKVVDALKNGQKIALISDAGTPLVSDPGYKLVQEAVAKGIDVQSVPGACAFLQALVLSGLAPYPFGFYGFLPKKKTERRKKLMQVLEAQMTSVFYESPHRVQECLEDILDVFGDCKLVLARELTKKYEEVLRGDVSEVLEGLKRKPVKGEIVLVVEASPKKARESEEEIDRRLLELLQNHSVKEAVATVTEGSQWSKKEVYQRALSLK